VDHADGNGVRLFLLAGAATSRRPLEPVWKVRHRMLWVVLG
jgi:hypothetical protein